MISLPMGACPVETIVATCISFRLATLLLAFISQVLGGIRLPMEPENWCNETETACKENRPRSARAPSEGFSKGVANNVPRAPFHLSIVHSSPCACVTLSDISRLPLAKKTPLSRTM